MNTNDLIASLSAETPRPRLGTPAYYALRLMGVLLAYGLGAQIALGIRLDLTAQFVRPLFTFEIFLLALLTGASAWAAILSMYPDRLQSSRIFNLPYAIFCILMAFIILQLFMPHDPRMALPDISAHSIECALCIAAVAAIPSALILILLRKGASIHPLRSGSFAVLAASGIGGLTLRIAEENDSVMHLATWHYLPTLLFAVLGASIGKFLLKW
jgi:hypothetical protein